MTAESGRTNAVLAHYRGSLPESVGAHFAKWVSIGKGAFGASIFYIGFLAMYESALMFPEYATASTLGGSVAIFRWLPLPGLAIQAWAIHRLLSLNTPSGVRPRRWLVFARLAFGSLPLAGVVALPLWDALRTRLPAWGFRGTPKVASLVFHDSLPDGSGRLAAFERRRLARIVPLGSLLFGGFLTYFLGAWLASTDRLRPTLPVLTAFAVVHIIVAGTSFLSDTADLEEGNLLNPRRSFLRWLSMLWLLPIPFGVIGWLLQQRLSGYTGLMKGLVAHLFHEPSSGRTLGRVLSSPSTRWWNSFLLKPLPLQADVSGSAGKRLPTLKIERFHRWKTLLLVIDSGVVTASIKQIVRWLPALRSLVLVTILLASLAFLGLSLLWGCHSIFTLGGIFKPRARKGILGLIGQGDFTQTLAALAFGGAAGWFLYSAEEGRVQWALVAGFGLFLAVLLSAQALGGPLSYIFAKEVPASWYRAAFGLALAAISAWIILAPTLRWLGLQALILAGVLTPLWSFRLYQKIGGWTFRPFALRDVFDRRLPLRLRAGVAFMMVTSAIPFGGLGSPIAIPLRRSLWPDAERRWWAIERQRIQPPLLPTFPQ